MTRNFAYVNAAMQKSGELAGQHRQAMAPPGSALEIVHPDDRAACQADLEAAAGWGDDHVDQYPLRLRVEDGRWQWLTACERVFRRDARGAATHILGVGHAIDLGSGEENAFVAERRHSERLQATIALQQEIATSQLDPQALMSLIAPRPTEHCRSRGAFVCLLRGEELLIAAAAEQDVAYVGRVMHGERSLAARCIVEQRTLFCRNTENDPHTDQRLAAAVQARTLVVTPLCARDGTLGALAVFSAEVDGIEPVQGRCLELVANLLTTALEQARALVAREAAIDEARAAQRAPQEVKEVAEQAARVMADFFAVMSHEIWTRLNGVMGMIEGATIPVF